MESLQLKMSNNITDGLVLCIDSEICLNSMWTLIIYTINSIVCAVNILHLLVLRRLHRLRGKPYLTILQTFSITDIAISMSIVALSCCPLRQLIRSEGYMLGSILSGVITTLSLFKMYVIALASQERYLTICQPLTHIEHLEMPFSHLKLCLLAVLTLLLVVVGIGEYMFNSDLCMNYVLGPTLLHKSKGASILFLALALSGIAFIAVRAAYIFKEIRRIILKSKHRHQMNTFKHILLELCALACLLPLTVWITLNLLGIYLSELLWTALLAFNIHGALSTFICGWVMAAYRQEVGLLLRCTSRRKRCVEII